MGSVFAPEMQYLSFWGLIFHLRNVVYVAVELVYLFKQK